jgi:hypothetical protein
MLPKDFEVSDEVKTWAKVNNHSGLEEHLKNFKLTCSAHEYKYVNWDSAFKSAILKNWARIDKGKDDSFKAEMARAL